MKTAIIVGAGATLAEALSSRPKAARTPPLDATFFSLCDDAKLTGRETVGKYMRENYGIDVRSYRYTMEEVFNFLHADAVMPTPSKDCLRAYWDLTQMYMQAIRLTTNSLTGKSRSGVGALLRFLIDQDPDTEISFITFNQDLVIEKSIELTSSMKKYESIPWNVRQCYNVKFSELIASTSAAVPKFKASPKDVSIPILKLHGSLNWFTPVRSLSDPLNATRTSGLSPRLSVNRTMTETTSRNRQPSAKVGKKIHLRPVIVPPIFEKTPHFQKTLGPVWSLAEEKLTEAERLIVFGYSFPGSDFAARALFRRCFQKNKTLLEIYVVDPNPDAGARISRLTGVRSTHLHNDLESFRSNFR